MGVPVTQPQRQCPVCEVVHCYYSVQHCYYLLVLLWLLNFLVNLFFLSFFFSTYCPHPQACAVIVYSLLSKSQLLHWCRWYDDLCDTFLFLLKSPLGCVSVLTESVLARANSSKFTLNWHFAFTLSTSSASLGQNLCIGGGSISPSCGRSLCIWEVVEYCRSFLLSWRVPLADVTLYQMLAFSQKVSDFASCCRNHLLRNQSDSSDDTVSY